MTDSFGFSIFVIAVVLVLGAFAVGTQWNLRKGNEFLRWLREGLTVFGERTTFRWLGSSVIELKMQKAKAPFRQMDVLVALEPRDIPPVWLFFRLRGRRDLLILRGQLRETPGYDLEVVAPGAWTVRGIAAEAERKGWKALEAPAASTLRAFASEAHPEPAPGELIRLATVPGMELIRLAVHRSVPNLEIQWVLSKVPPNPARQALQAVQQIGERIA